MSRLLRISSNHILFILKFLEHHDKLRFRQICKITKNLFDFIPQLINELCFFHNLPQKDDYFSCYGDLEEFIVIKKLNLQQIIQNGDSQNYLKINKDFISLKNKCFQFIQNNNIINTSQDHKLINIIFKIFKNPNLPILRLRKERNGIYCETTFQNKLIEIYEDRQFQFTFQRRYDETDQMQVFQKYLFTNQKQLLYESIDFHTQNQYIPQFQKLIILLQSCQYDEQSVEQRQTIIFAKEYFQNLPTIIQIIILLNQIITMHVELLSIYLLHVANLNNNDYDLLSEYTIKWSEFVASICELCDLFDQCIFKTFNDMFEKCFPQQSKSSPQLNPLRICMNKWNNQILQKNNQQLFHMCNKALIRLLIQRRNQYMNHHYQIEKVQDKFDNDFFYPEEIQQSDFQNSYKFSNFCATIKESNNNFYKIDKVSQSHEFFSHFQYYFDNLLKCYINSIADISHNEASAHLCGDSNLSLDYPYLQFEKQFLIQSQAFYAHYYDKKSGMPLFFGQNFDLYYDFLDTDQQYLRKIFLERTIFKNERIGIYQWIKALCMQLNDFQITHGLIIKLINEQIRIDTSQIEKIALDIQNQSQFKKSSWDHKTSSLIIKDLIKTLEKLNNHIPQNREFPQFYDQFKNDQQVNALNYTDIKEHILFNVDHIQESNYHFQTAQDEQIQYNNYYLKLPNNLNSPKDKQLYTYITPPKTLDFQNCQQQENENKKQSNNQGIQRAQQEKVEEEQKGNNEEEKKDDNNEQVCINNNFDSNFLFMDNNLQLFSQDLPSYSVDNQISNMNTQIEEEDNPALQLQQNQDLQQVKMAGHSSSCKQFSQKMMNEEIQRNSNNSNFIETN